MKTTIPALTLAFCAATFALAQSIPSGGVPASDAGVLSPRQAPPNYDSKIYSAQPKIQKVKSGTTSPNDDEINQMTPDITNYVDSAHNNLYHDTISYTEGKLATNLHGISVNSNQPAKHGLTNILLKTATNSASSLHTNR